MVVSRRVKPTLEYIVASSSNKTKKAATKSAAAAPAPKATAKKPAKADAPAELERHPLSEKYGPKMGDDELAGLAEDIKQHGLHEPIIVYEGKVLAGWNRYRACLSAKYEPKLREKDEASDPVAVAFGTNFMRRKLSSVQKAFYGAQFCLDRNLKQTDVAKQMACNLNRLNQCCQLLKLDSKEAKEVTEQLRDNPELSSAQFDEYMLELGIAREPKQAPRPARASAGGPLDGDDDDGLGDVDVDDLTGGAIDGLLADGDDGEGDEESPSPATRKNKGEGGPIGDDTPLPNVGSKRSKLTNPHETMLSRVASAFKKLDAGDQRRFVKFAWGKLRPALDAAFGYGDVEYTMPALTVDPSVIARNKPADKLDDGAPTGKKASKKNDKPTPAKKSTPTKAPAKAPAKGGSKAKSAPPAKGKAPAKGGKHAQAHDDDI